MPLAVLYGLPASLAARLRPDLRTAIKNGIADVHELNVTQALVRPSFILDEDELGESIDLILVITGLFVKPDRTPEIKQRLCEVLVEEIRLVVEVRNHGCSTKRLNIEVFTIPLDADRDGFAAYPAE